MSAIIVLLFISLSVGFGIIIFFLVMEWPWRKAPRDSREGEEGVESRKKKGLISGDLKLSVETSDRLILAFAGSPWVDFFRKAPRKEQRELLSGMLAKHLQTEQPMSGHFAGFPYLITNAATYAKMVEDTINSLTGLNQRNLCVFALTTILPFHFWNWPHQSMLLNREPSNGTPESVEVCYSEYFVDDYRNRAIKKMKEKDMRFIRCTLVLDGIDQFQLMDRYPNFGGWNGTFRDLKALKKLKQKCMSDFAMDAAGLLKNGTDDLIESTFRIEEQKLLKDERYSRIRKTLQESGVEAYPMGTEQDVKALGGFSTLVNVFDYYIQAWHQGEPSDALIYCLGNRKHKLLESFPQMHAELFLFGFNKRDWFGGMFGRMHEDSRIMEVGLIIGEKQLKPYREFVNSLIDDGKEYRMDKILDIPGYSA